MTDESGASPRGSGAAPTSPAGVAAAPGSAAAAAPPAVVPRRRNRARRIVVWAMLLGFMLIFARVLSQELGRARLSRDCEAKSIKACFNLCVQQPELQAPCDAVHAACASGDSYACGARSYLARHPPRRRW